MNDILKEHFKEAMQMFGLSNKAKVKIKRAFVRVKKDQEELENNVYQWIKYLNDQQNEILQKLAALEASRQK